MRTRLLLLLTLALCAFLRFYHLDGYGLWSDEFVTLLIVSSSSFQELVQTCFDVPQPMPPLYFLANKWMYGFFAPGEIGLRALSAVGSVLAGILLFATGRALFNAEIGLWGLMLFAVNSTQIVYAQNARPYAVCLMLSSASMFCFLKWKHQPSRAWALGYVVSTALLLHTHYIFFPLLLIQWLFLAVGHVWPAETNSNPVRWKSWLALQAGIAVLLLPLAPQLWSIVHARHSLNWESKYPAAKDLLVFFDVRLLLWSAGAWLGLVSFSRVMQKVFGLFPVRSATPNNSRWIPGVPSSGIVVSGPRRPVSWTGVWERVESFCRAISDPGIVACVSGSACTRASGWTEVGWAVCPVGLFACLCVRRASHLLRSKRASFLRECPEATSGARYWGN